jgi:hypothetical protein
MHNSAHSKTADPFIMSWTRDVLTRADVIAISVIGYRAL